MSLLWSQVPGSAGTWHGPGGAARFGQTIVTWAADPSAEIAEPGVVHAKPALADPDFAPCHDHPLLAEAATAVLGPDWHLAALSLRAPGPGCGHQGLHPDFELRRTAGR